MKLTEKKIIEILENNSIENCTKSEKSQVFKYAFGEEFMDSDDKGTLKQYNNQGETNERILLYVYIKFDKCALYYCIIIKSSIKRF